MVHLTQNPPGDSDVFSPTPQKFSPGQLIGKFEIVRRLGEGGMGTVYLAHDPAIQRDVAIKVLTSTVANDESSFKRFLAEARAAGKLNHPNVIAVYEIEEYENESLLVMEFAKGGSVADRLRGGKPYDVLRATEILLDACSGIAAAHDIHLIHRDVKPANLMLDENGTVKVADFGLVRNLESRSSELTLEDQIIGTPYFMSPEQCTGGTIDHRSDIYSLGATYFTLLTGQSPYEKSGSSMQIILAHVHDAIPDPRAIVSDLPPACGRIIARAMAKNADDRYQSAADMKLDLQALVAMLKDKSSSHVIRYRGTVVNNRELLVLPSERPGATSSLSNRPGRPPGPQAISPAGAPTPTGGSVESKREQNPIDKTSVLNPASRTERTPLKEGSTAALSRYGKSISPLAGSSPVPSSRSSDASQKPATGPAAPSKSSANQPSQQLPAGLRQEVYTLTKGELVLTWPEQIREEDLEEADAWLDLMKRKLRRAAKRDS